MTEREWREASDMRQATMSVAAIAIVAATLRALGLGGGAAYTLQPGEAAVIDRAVAMMQAGSLHPQSFEFPSLFLYVQFGTAILQFLAGATAGEWQSLDGISTADFYLWGRAVTAVIGTVTVLIVYLIGLRWGTRPALLGAGLMAVIPLHVRDSQLALTSAPLAFFVALTWLLSLRAHEQPRAGTFAWAGAAAGLAAGTAYSGVLTLLLPLVAIWMTPAARPSRLLAALTTIGVAAAAFLLTSPYVILDLPAFLNGYAGIIRMPAAAATRGERLAVYLTDLRQTLHWPAFLLMIGGATLAIVRAARGPGRVRWALALAFPVVYLSLLPRHVQVSGRYVMPLLPFACILAATAVVSGVSLLRRFSIPRALRTSLIVALTVATLLPPSLASVRFTRAVRTPGTPALAYAWMTEHVPAGSQVAVESGGLLLRRQPFRVRHVRELRDHPYADYAAAHVSYLVASSHAYDRYFAAPEAYPREHAEYARLFQSAREVARFTPSPEHPGPELRILEVR